jgi:hypothetical protein
VPGAARAWPRPAHDLQHREAEFPNINTKEGDMTNVPISADDDPRLAHTGVEVAGREVIDDHVLLAFFEHILERGEAYERRR